MEGEDSVGNLDLDFQVNKLLEVPSFDESRKYFSEICDEKGWAVEVKPDEEGGKGKGLFATKDFCPGDLIILEAPLVGAQEQENRPECVVCSQCSRHIGGVGYQLSWWLMNHKQGDKESQEICRALMDGTICVPFSESFEKGSPVMCPSNCGDIYCSRDCQSQAWKDHHSFLCMFADDQEISLSVNRDGLKELETLSLQTNPNLLMAAKVIAIVLIRAISLLEEKCTDLAGVGHEECWPALLHAWLPLRHAWKVIWWETVPPPSDVVDKDGFIDNMRDLITDFSEVLEDAFQASHMFPALFHRKVIASIMGMFEQNNIAIDVPSPLELYLDNLNQTQHKSLQSMGIMRDLIVEAAECPLQGTGYYPVACCANHSCAPNAIAVYRADEDDGSNVCMIAAHKINAGDEINISYVDLSLCREERRKELEDYGFLCNCKVCEEENTFARE